MALTVYGIRRAVYNAGVQTRDSATQASDEIVADSFTDLTRSDFQQQVRDAKRPVVVAFTAEWAEQADQFDEILEDFVEEFGDQLEYYRVDVDEEGRLANDFHIADVPTFIGFFHGNVMFRTESQELDDPPDALDLARKLTSLPGVAA